MGIVVWVHLLSWAEPDANRMRGPSQRGLPSIRGAVECRGQGTAFGDQTGLCLNSGWVMTLLCALGRLPSACYRQQSNNT